MSRSELLRGSPGGLTMGAIGKRIQKLVPQRYTQFNKLTKGTPYHFKLWKRDKQKRLCLYYWFWDRTGNHKNTKRVPLVEIEAAAQQLSTQGVFDRCIFHKYCAVSKSDGPCGFAVIGRCLEFLGLAKYAGHGNGFM